MSFLHSLCRILGVLLAFAAVPALRSEVKVGDRFPSLEGAGLAGSLPQTRGQVVLVDFWASWCEPCRASFPAYARIHADFAARGLVIVAVSVDEKPAAYSAFLKRNEPPFSTVRDQDRKLVQEVRMPAMPTSYLIDREGRVRFIHPGFHGWETEARLRSEIETLLSGRP